MKKEFTTKEVAKLLGVSHDTVTRWAKKGKLKARRAGAFIGPLSPFLIPASEVERVKKLQYEQAKK